MQEILEQAKSRGLLQDLRNGEETPEQELERRRKQAQSLCDEENSWVGNLDKIDGYNCDLCKNKGYIVRPRLLELDNDYEVVQVMCKCNRARHTIIMLKNSGLDKVLDDYRFDNFETKEVWQKGMLDKAKEYLSDTENNWFFVGGQSGCGKTHICTALSVELVKRGKDFRYCLWKDDSRKIKGGADIIDELKEVEVLYIDDLFKSGLSEGQTSQRPTQADINIAFEILNSRDLSRKPTIISSETTLTEMIDIDTALAGRIRARCGKGKYVFNVSKDLSKNYRLK